MRSEAPDWSAGSEAFLFAARLADNLAAKDWALVGPLAGTGATSLSVSIACTTSFSATFLSAVAVAAVARDL